jgi:hypothetical protein
MQVNAWYETAMAVLMWSLLHGWSKPSGWALVRTGFCGLPLLAAAPSTVRKQGH